MGKERNMMNECCRCEHKEDVPGNCHIKCNMPDALMEGNQHGIQNGWFFYPLLFDPTWKVKMCRNYKEKQLANVVSQSVSVASKSV